MADATPENPFWNFSADIYRRPGVSAACIRLQDNHGADINLLLYCCWVAQATHRRLTAGDFTALDRSIADWRHNVIRPLRSARRWVKHADWAGTQNLYDGLLATELDAERIAQGVLFACERAAGAEPETADVTAIAAANMAAYMTWLGATPTTPDIQSDCDSLSAALTGR